MLVKQRTEKLAQNVKRVRPGSQTHAKLLYSVSIAQVEELVKNFPSTAQRLGGSRREKRDAAGAV